MPGRHRNLAEPRLIELAVAKEWVRRLAIVIGLEETRAILEELIGAPDAASEDELSL